MEIQELTGYYTYRTFIDKPFPVNDFNTIKVEEAELFLVVHADGGISGTLSHPPEPRAETKSFIDISGSIGKQDESIQVGASPQGIAYDPVHQRMYVTNFGTNTVSVIDTNSTSVINSYHDIDSPFGIAYDEENNRIYVTSIRQDLIYMIDTNTNKVVGGPISVGSSPKGIAYDPVHDSIYVANSNSSSVSVSKVTPLETTIISSIDGNGYGVNDGASTLSDEITFSFDGTGIPQGIVKRFECSIDESTFVSCSSPYSYRNLPKDTQPTFSVRVLNEEGNMDITPATFMWQIISGPNPVKDSDGTRCLDEDSLATKLNGDNALTHQSASVPSSIIGDQIV